jgi:hypothetical protein
MRDRLVQLEWSEREIIDGFLKAGDRLDKDPDRPRPGQLSAVSLKAL